LTLLETEAQLPKQCYVFGAGGFVKSVVAALQDYGVNPLAVLDTQVTGDVSGIPISRPNAGIQDVPVVVGVCNLFGDPTLIYREREDLGFSQLISPVQLFKILGDKGYSREHYWLTTDFSLFDREQDGILAFHGLLEDHISVSLYDNFIRYRSHGDVSLLPAVLSITEQYLPKDLPVVPKPMRLIECGAYVGEITKYVRDLNFDVETIFAFEPDPINFAHLLECINTPNLKRSALALSMVVGHRTEQVRFTSGENLGSAISPTGDTVNQGVSIGETLSVSDINYVKWKLKVRSKTPCMA